MMNSFMLEAIIEAKKAREINEVPVGAIIVKDGVIISRAYNTRERDQNVICHAELIAIKKACEKLNSWRLDGCDLYVTLEPCTMCAGAIIQSRIANVYFGAKDKKAGAVVSILELFDNTKYNHRPNYYEGIESEKCEKLLKNFFKQLRNKK